MKILQVNNHYESLGGSESVFHDTTKLLKSNGHDVYYFSSTQTENYGKNDNGYLISKSSFTSTNNIFEIFHNIKNFIYSTKVKKLFENYIKLIKPDIVHLHIFYGIISNSILPILKKYNIPVVMTLHEYRMICPTYLLINGKGEQCQKCGGRNFFYAIKYKCNKNNYLYSALSALESYFKNKVTPYEDYIDYFIMVSDFSRNMHLKYLPYLKSKSTVIYNFYDRNSIIMSEQTSINFIYFGRLSPEKGIETLLKAFKAIPNAKLTIAGDGPLLDRVLKCSKKYKNINYIGFKNKKELMGILSSAKFTVVPSICYENNPLSIVESFSNSVPVIGSDFGGITELINENIEGYLFKMGDSNSLKVAIRKAINIHPESYEKMKSNCLKFAQTNFGSKYHYRRLMSVYNKVLN